MKTITALILGFNFLFVNSFNSSKKTDIQALKVIEKRTERNGIYYHYIIKNAGNTIIPAESYQVFLKINGETVSFDKSTTTLQPGQTINYESQKTFYIKENEILDYILEVKMNDSKSENNKLTGQSTFKI
jgi:hypothetical protein